MLLSAREALRVDGEARRGATLDEAPAGLGEDDVNRNAGVEDNRSGGQVGAGRVGRTRDVAGIAKALFDISPAPDIDAPFLVAVV